VPWLDRLPATTVALVAADGGVLDLLEQVHGVKVIKCMSACLVNFPAVCCQDVVRLCEIQGLKASFENVSSGLDLLQGLGVTLLVALPSMPDTKFYATKSKEMKSAQLQRYFFADDKSLELSGAVLVASQHISFETDSACLRRLLPIAGLHPDSSRVSHVRSLLEAEDSIMLEPDFRSCHLTAFLSHALMSGLKCDICVWTQNGMSRVMMTQV
jgi:hypothetical protein